MGGVPVSVADFLSTLIHDERALAYLLVDASLTLVRAGGNLKNYGLGALELGRPLSGQAAFLEGLLPLVETPLRLPSVELSCGRAADLHCYSDREGDWVVILDVTAERDEHRRYQQRAYDMTLLREREAQLNQQLATANQALAFSHRELQRLSEKLKEENLRLSAEVEVARQLQQMLLPTVQELDQIRELDIACFMLPADEVGGDYYDVLRYGDRTLIAIGDVTGHGLQSGVVMLMAQVGVRTLMASNETDPVRFFGVLNRTIHDNVARMGGDKSLSLAVLDYKNGEVRLSGQHEEIIVVRSGGEIDLVDTLELGFPIGLEDDISDFIHEKRIQLKPGDGMVLYTDGFTEAENPAGEQYGLERLCKIISRNWTNPAKAIMDAVVFEVRDFIDVQTIYDDLTLVVVKQK